MCFALAMAMLDNTVVNVALPTISRELGTGVSGLQWIVDAYVLAFASFLLTGGIAGDRYGRKRIFLTGLTIFTLASALCGLSQTELQLIVARALQGVGAALLLPGTLSIITVTFPPYERAKAIGLWAGMSGVALALGPTVGGLMVEHLGWQSVFFRNLPIGVVAFLLTRRTVRESTSEITRELDFVGLVLGSAALLSATYGLIEGNQKGWTDPLPSGVGAPPRAPSPGRRRRRGSPPGAAPQSTNPAGKLPGHETAPPRVGLFCAGRSCAGLSRVGVSSGAVACRWSGVGRTRVWACPPGAIVSPSRRRRGASMTPSGAHCKGDTRAADRRRRPRRARAG